MYTDPWKCAFAYFTVSDIKIRRMERKADGWSKFTNVPHSVFIVKYAVTHAVKRKLDLYGIANYISTLTMREVHHKKLFKG